MTIAAEPVRKQNHFVCCKNEKLDLVKINSCAPYAVIQQRRSLGDIRIVACNEKIREIRVRLKRIILSVEHESFETKQLIRVIRAIRVPKKIRNSRAEKYLLL